MMDEKELSRILSDAHVIDFDLYKWDRSIRVCVVADHIEPVEPGRLPIVVIEFVDPVHVGIEFRHASIVDKLGGAHVQWRVDRSRIDRIDCGFVVQMSGHEHMPSIEIRCLDVRWAIFRASMLDDMLPGWDAAGGPLARPGILEILNAKESRRAEGPERPVPARKQKLKRK